MKTRFSAKRDKRGDYVPKVPLSLAPLFAWPTKPIAILKWLFGYPGYFFPWGVVYMAIPITVWIWFTPPLEEMRTFAVGWIAYTFVRNCILMALVGGAWHVYLHTLERQGTDYKYSNRWLARGNSIFLFKNQLLDNLFWTFVSGVPIWTAYEVLTMWMYANGYIPYVSFEEHPVYCTFMLCIVPMLRDLHFYLIHRLIHWGPLYKWVHYLHHNNVNVGPFSGTSMHPVEHLFYWSGVLVHWIIPSHPIHALFHTQHAALTPAQGHAGFEKVALAEGVEVETHDYFHYLHHKYFECNYAGQGPWLMDKWFGTFHDGTKEATEAMNARFFARAEQKRKADGSS